MPNIYPIELILKKTTESVDMVSYLDVSIHISSGKFVTDVFEFQLSHCKFSVPR